MNTIREIQALNAREIENGVSTEASWHADYRDTAYIYVGGLPFELSEGDVVTICSQFGEPVHINLVRDKETGKSKGFAFLKYEDQRSTDLAVDNLGGATVMGRTLKVDHTRYKRKDEDETGDNLSTLQPPGLAEDGKGRRGREEDESESAGERARPLLKEEQELAALMRTHDDDDPMKDYLIQEKKEEVQKALVALKHGKHKKRRDKRDGHGHRHRQHRSDRNRDDASDNEHSHRRH